VRGYLEQQLGYGRCEALLERKWPERYNGGGHVTWTGRVYGNGHNLRRWRIYYGTWGSELFQSRRERPAGVLASIPTLPEWMLIVAGLGALSALGILWNWMFLGLALFCLAILAPVANAVAHASRAVPARLCRRERVKRWTLATGLHLAQPVARLSGRMREGLVPWRRRGIPRFALPLPRTRTVWSEEWRSAEDWLRRVESRGRTQGVPVSRGGAYDRWDLQIQGGVLGSTRTRMAVEEHGSGKQLLRFRSWPKLRMLGLGVALTLTLVACAAKLDGAWLVSVVLGIAAAGVLIFAVLHAGTAAATLADVLAGLGDADDAAPAPAPARQEHLSREAAHATPATVSELVDMRPSESRS
jgi:hypothetical protein